LAHPLIFSTIQKKVGETAGDVFVEVPLLAESGQRKLFDRVWLVVSDKNIRTERLKNHRKMLENDVFSVMDAQCGDAERLAIANDIIENNGKIEELEESVINLYNKLHKQ
jgi:dephospho-CoA kinase